MVDVNINPLIQKKLESLNESSEVKEFIKQILLLEKEKAQEDEKTFKKDYEITISRFVPDS
ncbi:MAG: hypothetical protein WAO91_04595 [Candidatus Nitrosotenuis sp.]